VSTNNLVIVGAGGHASVIVDAILSRGEKTVVGLVAPSDEPVNSQFPPGIDVIGSDHDLRGIFERGVQEAAIGIGSIGDSDPRTRIFELLTAIGFVMPNVVHASAIVSGTAKFSSGVQVLAGSVVNAGARINDNVIINTAAIVEHDCEIGMYAHIAPGSILGGGVVIGDRTHVGIGAIVREGVTIGADVMIGAGAMVLNDVPDQMRVAGVPAREI
jgi:sugar O-acyltransferase (sialic acid O-acetyltransferase NeuD family)